jgi:hypothetical protein
LFGLGAISNTELTILRAAVPFFVTLFKRDDLANTVQPEALDAFRRQTVDG